MQRIQIERLLEKVHRAQAHGGDRIVELAVGGHHQRRYVRDFAAQPVEKIQPVAVGQAQIQHREIGPPATRGQFGVGDVLAHRHGIAIAAQTPIQRAGQRALVFQQQDVGASHGGSLKGRWIVTQVPPPGAGA